VAYPIRYGFIGTGSEANSFDGTVGPTSEWNGGLDEVRIYSSALDGDAINLTKDLAGEVSSIDSITEVINGDVMSVYEVSWTDSEINSDINMSIIDTWSFYRSLNSWKVSRTYRWSEHIFPGYENQFAAWNTFNWDTYDPQLLTQDWYFYDDQMHEGHSNVDFTPENYTVLHDFDGDNYYTALGLFITDKRVDTSGDISEIKWKINIDETNDIINFVPGNETDLDTGGTLPQHTLSVDYWSYIRNDVDSYGSAANAKDYFDNYYQSLTTDPIITPDQEESLFFNFEVNVYDHDGNNVPGVNVTLLNYTLPYSTEYVDSDLSNDYGNVTFYGIPANNYTVNLTYAPNGYSKVLSLGEYNLTINHTETTYLNTKMVSYLVNMTSLVLHFASTNDDPLVGAVISFNENSTGTDKVIGPEYTDVNGNVTLRWENFTVATEINFTCYFLGNDRLFSITGGAPFDPNASVTMTSLSYHTANVSIDDFETFIALADESPVDAYNQTFWRQSLEYNITYSYELNSSVLPISGADVSYTIQSRDTIIDEGNFGNTDGAGFANCTFDYVDYESILKAGTGYTLRITASKDGYTTMVGVTNIEFTNLNTSITLDGAPLSIDWKQNLTLSVFYNDEFTDLPIDGASVSYVDFNHPEINGVLSPDVSKGAGWYKIELNSSETFNEIGIINLEIIASLQNYETKTYKYNFTITAIGTSLTLEDLEL